MNLRKLSVSLFFLIISITYVYAADIFVPFEGEVREDNINLRSDSTASSGIICVLSKNQTIEVVAELYDWYKVRLPQTCPVYIRKDMVSVVDEKTAKVVKDNVNLRFSPDEKSPIIGKASINEAVCIMQEKGNWWQISPLKNCAGWVHKKFITKKGPLQESKIIKTKKEVILKQEVKKEEAVKKTELLIDVIVLEGVVEPYGKVLGRKATHKLLTYDNKVYFISGNVINLNSLLNHKVKITGKLEASKKEKFPVIDIIKLEIVE